MHSGWGARITSGILPSALTGQRRFAPLFKFAPGEFVEPCQVLILSPLV
jgi:hypothetical protein